MKKNLIKATIIAIAAITIFGACKRNPDYILSTPAPYISALDVRKIYMGNAVTLNKTNMREAYVLRGQVTSDHSGGNLPMGLLMVQNKRASGNGIDSLRGIAINIGSAAANYGPGDSVTVNLEGGTISRINGILQITGLTEANVTKVATGIKPFRTSATAVVVQTRPDFFESCYVVAYDCNFEPNIGVETIEGDKNYNDGSGDMQMHVSSTANFKNTLLPWSANVYGVCLPSATTGKMQIWPRKASDFEATSIVVDPTVPLGPNPAIITGYYADPHGTDTNYEYVQFMATQDLDFRQTPFSVYTTNNAGASTPIGVPTLGWNTGDLRTYKFNITKGTVAKGQFFYVGGYKKATGSASLDMSSAKWVANKLYGSVTGDDGVGATTTNLLANSGNPAGIAIFPFTNVELTSTPSDVVFYGGTGGTVYGSGTGYAICTNDLYTRTATNIFFRESSSINKFVFVIPVANYFTYLGGVYNTTLKKWTIARTHNSVQMLQASSNQATIETMSGATKLTN